MKKNKMMIISHNEQQNADIETQSKQFFIGQNQIRYEKKTQIIENKHGTTKGINVVNELCRLDNNKLTKRTYVYVQDKVIKIEDEFYLENDLRSVKVDSENYEMKKPLQQKVKSKKKNVVVKSIKDQQRKNKKKDFKNIVKNIVKIFMHWLNKYPNKQSCTGLMDQLLEFHNYNNSLIRAMSEIPQINEAFTIFLFSESKQLIESSRIRDKGTHLERLKKYEGLFGRSKKSTGIKTNGNGSKEGNSSDENKNGSMSGSEEKEKVGYNSMNEQNNDNELNGEKMFADSNGEMNENINNSKGSDPNKFSNSSDNGSYDNNRSNWFINGSIKENYARRDGIKNRRNHIFYLSGSDQ